MHRKSQHPGVISDYKGTLGVLDVKTGTQSIILPKKKSMPDSFQGTESHLYPRNVQETLVSMIHGPGSFGACNLRTFGMYTRNTWSTEQKCKDITTWLIKYSHCTLIKAGTLNK